MAIDGEVKVSKVIEEAKESMGKALDHLKAELEKMRAGRATMHTLDPVKVDSYGSLVPVSQVATISIPEPRQITITPWDKNMIKEIEKGIINSNLGFNPSSDGSVVRVTIPALTEETRKNLVKEVKKLGENCKVSIRNARKQANSELDRLAKDEGVSENRRDNEKITVQELTDDHNTKVDEILKEKETEVMTV
ncbi:MAG: ribosome recycling factor [Candidatus Cloacimonadota bacterium]|nr:MAG: ribosome recycling factor [Candidatus Cloacimonadota bacterium]PIE78090.1 MAG: ribosome recycling factor [Candidatus Delongbacteria bacterium]